MLVRLETEMLVWSTLFEKRCQVSCIYVSWRLMDSWPHFCIRVSLPCFMTRLIRTLLLGYFIIETTDTSVAACLSHW